jgi:hypothetical protein
MSRTLSLRFLAGTFVVAKLDPSAPIPVNLSGELVSVTRTADELSIVCSEDTDFPAAHRDPGWRCIKLDGVWDFGETGVLASVAGPLADAGISILAIATFNTDYVLVKTENVERAVTALQAAGHQVMV